MGFTIISISFVAIIFAFMLYLGYTKKNAFLILFSSIISFLLTAMIWVGGIVEQTGSVVSGNVTSSTVALVQTAVYTKVNLGFNQNYIAMLFALFGIFIFIQAIGAFSQEEGGKI